MADAFNTLLDSPTSAPTVPKGIGGSSPSITQEATLGDLFKGIAPFIKEGASALSNIGDSEIEKGVDQAVTRSMEGALDPSSGAIDAAVADLSKMQTAVNQGKGTQDRFYLNLIDQAKKLKNQFPNKTAEIDKAFRDKGLIDPRLGLINNQEAREKKLRDDQATMENAVIAKAVEAGVAAHVVPGDITSPIDRGKTLQSMADFAAAQASQKRTEQAMGIYRDGNSKPTFGLSSTFMQNFPTMQSDMWTIAMTGLRGSANQLNNLIKNAKPGDVKLVQDAFGAVAAKKDEFLLQAQANTVKMKLNPEESKAYLDAANAMVMGVTSGVTGIDKVTDLNSLSARAKALSWAVDNSKLVMADSMPTVFAMANGLPEQIANTFFNFGKYSDIALAGSLGKQVKLDLERLNRHFAKSAEDKPDIPSASVGLSTNDKRANLVDGIRQQQEWVSKGASIQKPEHSYSWIMSQADAMNAYAGGLDGASLTPRDKASLATQMTSQNYLGNLKVSEKFHPEAAKQVGGYAFDVVMDSTIEAARELQNAGVGTLKMGKELSITYDFGKNQFVLKRPPTYANAGAAMANRPMENRAVPPEIAIRLATLNRNFNAMKQTREYKETFSAMSEVDFVRSIQDDVFRQFGIGGSSQSIVPFLGK